MQTLDSTLNRPSDQYFQTTNRFYLDTNKDRICYGIHGKAALRESGRISEYRIDPAQGKNIRQFTLAVSSGIHKITQQHFIYHIQAQGLQHGCLVGYSYFQSRKTDNVYWIVMVDPDLVLQGENCAHIDWHPQ